MSFDHPYGKPVSVFRTTDNKEVIVEEEELETLFGHPEIQDHKIVILSTIGAFRGGKSFFLDYCLRFLYAHAVEEEVARQQAFLGREPHQILKLKEIQREAERMLIELVENGAIIEDEKHVRRREILEARIARIARIEVAMSAFILGAPFFPGGVVARLAVTAAGAVILRAISTVANRCTIM